MTCMKTLNRICPSCRVLFALQSVTVLRFRQDFRTSIHQRCAAAPAQRGDRRVRRRRTCVRFPLRWLRLCRAAVLVLCTGTQVFADGDTTTPRRKFIELGWDIPATALLRESWREMEQAAPFDGVMFKVEAKDDQGGALSSESLWDGRPWKREWLQPALADLKSCAFARFTDNFVRFNATPGTLDWADDAGWAALADKAGHCAWLMKQSGSKGLAIDFESYGAHQFKLDAAKGRAFAETAALARRRGGQFVGAIAREFPDAVLLALWMNSINLKAGASAEPDTILASSGYGLLPAFIDGMLDAAPPAMVLVDGCENGYYMDSAEKYLRAAHAMRSWNGGAIRLVSRANRPKYRQQVQAGFGFYLDMFLNDATNRYYRGPLDGSRLDRLERNPGFAHPSAEETRALPAEFGAWQDETTSSGKFTWDPSVGSGAGRATGVKWGCFIQSHDVKAGDTYAVEADGLSRGASNPTLVVRWQTAEGRWTHESDDRTFVFRPGAGDWRSSFGVVTVPPGAGRLVILLNVTGQIAETDVCWFDNLSLYRVW